MRSRPRVEVRLLPGVVRAGQWFEVHAAFDSRSDTPIDAVSFEFVGTEIVSWGTGEDGRSRTWRHVSLASSWTPGRFGKGRYNHAVRFYVPSTAPPTYAGRLARVTYELGVRVAIPWWPDRVQRYVVPVAPAPSSPVTLEPVVYTTGTDVSRGEALYAEATFDALELAPGGVLTGAVALTHAARHRVRGVGLSFVGTETASWIPASVETVRFGAKVFDGTPGDGVSIPFRVRLPESARPTFAGVGVRLEWHVEIAVAGGWKQRALLRVPFVVRPGLDGGAARAPQRPVPLVGRERRAQVWSAVAQGAGLVYDADAETLRGRAGARVDVRVAPEQRDARGVYTVARLEWPSLGADATVKPAQWSDALSPAEIELGDRAFDARFQVRGFAREQVFALLDADVRAALLGFPEATLDDRGATLATPGISTDTAGLARFVAQALAAARALDGSVARVPAPLEAAAWEPAWRAFAARLEGRFEPGRVWIRDATLGVERLALGLLWNGKRHPVGTAVRVALEPPLERSFDAETELASLPEPARPLARALASAEGASLRIGPDALELELATATADPASLESRLDQLASLARALRDAGHAGPYR